MGDAPALTRMNGEIKPYTVEDRIRALVTNGSVVTIGNFDGVHVGHRAILSSVREEARARGLPAVAITFEPHPVQVFGNRPADTFRLSTSDERQRLLLRVGADEVVTLSFTRDFAQLTPDTFIRELLREDFRATSVHVGWDFNFGRNRKGNTELLRASGDAVGLSVTVHDPVVDNALPVSSTRIRDHLRRGEIREANELLGAPWTVHSASRPGAGRGRTIGVPTINQYPSGRLLPPNGVYSTVVHLDSGERSLPAISNIGTRPTFDDGHETSLESFCLSNDPGTLAAGTPVAVSFLDRIRDEKRFASSEDLVAQIDRDIEVARRHHGNRPNPDS